MRRVHLRESENTDYKPMMHMAPGCCGKKWHVNQLMVIGSHGAASPYVSPLPCGSNILIEGSGCSSPRKAHASVWAPGQKQCPHVSSDLRCANVFCAPLTNAHVLK
ncbi:unnamed protein product [Schistosoma guineensis]|nr:unnamed protein product [Schistosoma guineensis]